MSDLKERLAATTFEGSPYFMNPDGPEALARIEELDAEVERYIKAYKIAHDQATANGAEANRLRQRIEELEGRLERAAILLERGVREALPDAMIFASHTNPVRYRKAVDDMRAWAKEARTTLSSIQDKTDD